jgi:hypothetical protein
LFAIDSLTVASLPFLIESLTFVDLLFIIDSDAWGARDIRN